MSASIGSTLGPIRRQHPHLALVIGSGGVRSVAALGVADVLWGRGLRPDLIVGCSAGALFGALLAMGLAPDRAISTASGLWTAELTHRRRTGAVMKMLAPGVFGFDADFSLRDDEPIVARLRAAFGERSFADLLIPLRVMATDATTGTGVVLDSGDLVQALRASIAMPFMLPPCHVQGQRLIDGFVSDPLPVSAAEDAQAVLALGFRAQLPRRIDGPSRLLAQFTSAMTNNLMQARIEAARRHQHRMLVLMPELDRRVGLFETAAMAELVTAGRQLAEREWQAVHELCRHQASAPAPTPGHAVA
jgi:NTE family protein